MREFCTGSSPAYNVFVGDTYITNMLFMRALCHWLARSNKNTLPPGYTLQPEIPPVIRPPFPSSNIYDTHCNNKLYYTV